MTQGPPRVPQGSQSLVQQQLELSAKPGNENKEGMPEENEAQKVLEGSGAAAARSPYTSGPGGRDSAPIPDEDDWSLRLLGS